MALFQGVKAIAFDLDQTLIDFAASRRAGLEALLAEIKRAGFTVDRSAFLARHRDLTLRDDDVYIKTGVWRPSETRLQTLAREFSLPGDGFVRRMEEAYVETRFANLRAYPESQGVLQGLAARYPLYLVTNGPAAPQHREIVVTGLSKFFRRLFVCDDYGLRKPDPRMFEMIRAEAGVEAAEMLIVGDWYEADIEVPRRLGWRTAWVVRDEDEHARADRNVADAVIRSVAEIPRLLEL